MTIVFTFPGQGSQAVGMGRDLALSFPEAKRVFDEVDEALGFRLSQVLWDGPEAQLTLTENAQPGLMAVSLAVISVLKNEYGSNAINPAFVAGHSLGEYSALASAGVFTLSDTAKLLRLRGLAMQQAVPQGQGAMLALLGIDLNQAEKLAYAAAENDVCQVANDNAPGQVVISGTKSAIDRAVAMSQQFGVRRAVPLSVSAPFHCALMQPAADRMAHALAEVSAHAPASSLVSNVTAKDVSDPVVIKDLLVKQVTGMVRWRESVVYMEAFGATTIFEIGSGKVLSGLAKRISSRLDARSIGTVDDIKAFGEWFKTYKAA